MTEPGPAEVNALLMGIQAARDRGDGRAIVVAELEFQASACDVVGSPLYGHLLRRAAQDARAGGATWEIMGGHAADPPFTALALRLMAAVHRLVLTGKAPGLAHHYASAGGTEGLLGADEAFIGVLRDNLEELRSGVARPCQTNEPARSAALVGGFLTVARVTGLPLRILEVGASAGLNLRWDHFRYEHDQLAWGPPRSPVTLAGVFESPPPLEVGAVVLERQGCDPNPQDPALEETRLNLMASAWADQVERFRTLEGALQVARQVPAVVDRADGAGWAEQQLSIPRPGVATVVYHSIVMQYMNDAGRARFAEVVTSAGERATAEAPVAWLSFEPGDGERAHVHLTTWPGGGKRLVATAGYHGRPVRWLG
ncbi:MAG TPA: DUF2332 domain-containing protein [Candidatus Dormibacteraeota bacterium]|nr:DUF2332 domain-containing protein [Candidatus Dormibacteraeota bacterium]